MVSSIIKPAAFLFLQAEQVLLSPSALTHIGRSAIAACRITEQPIVLAGASLCQELLRRGEDFSRERLNPYPITRQGHQRSVHARADNSELCCHVLRWLDVAELTSARRSGWRATSTPGEVPRPADAFNLNPATACLSPLACSSRLLAAAAASSMLRHACRLCH